MTMTITGYPKARPRVKYPYRSGIRYAFMEMADIPSADNPELVYLRRLRIAQTPWLPNALQGNGKTPPGGQPQTRLLGSPTHPPKPLAPFLPPPDLGPR